MTNVDDPGQPDGGGKAATRAGSLRSPMYHFPRSPGFPVTGMYPMALTG